MRDLRPTGTVTFLFTDIEGSTRLWEESPAAMRGALARHDALLRETIESSRGFVFKTVGDAFYGAFSTAADALAAALEAQQALQTEPWPEPTPIRVRMALHTGAAEERDGDYFGPPLNHVARLLAVGHGGQVLLSQTAQELARENLPAEVSLRDLGTHRLRDLANPESVYQLIHPSLPETFPPLRSLDNPSLPNNLPQQVTSFIGRERECADVKALLRRTRLLTLIGTGGAGKTRLSLQVAADLLDDYPDGVWFVELAALSDPALVPQAVAAQALGGIREENDRDLMRTLTDRLRGKQTLLVLDNCEHLLSACATLADNLLRFCPYLKILASSREGMGIAGEALYRVPSLSLPDPSILAAINSLSQYEAVSLFIERAAAAQPAFAVNNQNAPAVAQICWRLDGIPLAIELAAARVRALTVKEINDRLDDRFRFLTGGSRAALPRQQTLRALIDWSYELLDARSRILLERLSVFASGWTLAAAERVCSGGAIPEYDVFDLLCSLVDKSLVLAEPISPETTRYRLLETVRQYGRDRLREHDEEAAVYRRYRDWALELAETAAAEMHGPRQGMWLNRLESEHDNLRAAMDRRLQDDGEAETALRMATALRSFWLFRGYLTEARERVSAALALLPADPPVPAAVHAAALCVQGDIALSQGAYSDADAHAQQALSLTAENSPLRAVALRLRGAAYSYSGDYVRAYELLLEGLALARASGDRELAAGILIHLSRTDYLRGDYPRARECATEALNIYQRAEDRRGVARALYDLGQIHQRTGDYIEARSRYAESLSVARELNDQLSLTDGLLSLGSILYRIGDHEGASQSLLEGVGIAERIGARSLLANALIQLGNLALVRGDQAAARSYYERARDLAQELGARHNLSVILGNLGMLAREQNEDEVARGYHEESLAIAREIGDREGVLSELNNLGALAVKQGDFEAAHKALSESLEMAREIGSAWRAALTLVNLGDLHMKQGAYSEARACLSEAIPIFQRGSDAHTISEIVRLFSRLEMAEGHPDRAARLLGAANALQSTVEGASLSPGKEQEMTEVANAARAALGDDAYTAIIAEGAAFSLEQAVAYAVSPPPPPAGGNGKQTTTL